MMLWLVLALMTAAAIFAVLWPLSRRGALRGGSDVAVYRDQLDEIERDRVAGLIGEREAEAARIEVSRRLIAAADADAPAPPPDGATRPRPAAAPGGRPGPRAACRDRSAHPVAARRRESFPLVGFAAAFQPAAGGAARTVARANSSHGAGRAGRGASGAESGRCPRLGGGRAGLYAARPL